jgi:hypothetical protein
MKLSRVEWEGKGISTEIKNLKKCQKSEDWIAL